MILFHEHDHDPEMRPEPISRKSARSSCTWLLGSRELIGISGRADDTSSPVRSVPNPGAPPPRLDMTHAPAGSGKKYKKCRGGATVN
jgi:hypothetical protein